MKPGPAGVLHQELRQRLAEECEERICGQRRPPFKVSIFFLGDFDASWYTIIPGHPNVLEKSTSPPFRTTFEQIEQKWQIRIDFSLFFLNVHFLQIVDFLGSACCSCTHFRGQFNKLRYCAKTVHLFVHIIVSACFGRTNFTNMHKNDCATRAQFCATRAQFCATRAQF